MANLYLLKSKVKDKKYDSGDVIINLDKFTSIMISQRKPGFFHLVIQLGKDVNHACFSEEKDARSELENIIKLMGEDESQFFDYKINDPSEIDETKEKIRELIRSI